MTTFSEALAKELEQEAAATRKLLALVPADKPDWKPHAKSMGLKQLANHVAETAGWVGSIIEQSDLDLSKEPFEPQNNNGGEELTAFLDDNVKKSANVLRNTTDADLDEIWTMRNGDMIFMQMPKYDAIRHSLGQQIHHRGQLGVYLRMLDIPLPGVYGPSADEM